DELKETLRRQTIVRKVMRREVQSKIRVTEAEIKNFREENRDQYETRARVRVGVLMLDIESQGLFSKSAVEKKAKVLHEKLENGADFAVLVKEFSDGPATDNSGDIGFLEKGKTLPVIENVAFQLEVGNFSRPLKTDFGWVIVKVLEKIEEGVQPLSEVRDEIENIIRNQKSREMESDWFEKQRAKTYVQIMD
ncbi:peptidylprolyl isomerase, partial [bacterium]|nr:peptidylprolyl isomerase [bacterium]